MFFFSSIIDSLSLQQNQGSSIAKFLSHNNTPVNNFCSSVPIVQPSLISSSFGKSLISLFVLIIYLVLYRVQNSRTGVESRLLSSLIVGNVIVAVLTFNDWFNLHHQIILCNDYKNGVMNLYQVSEALEKYKLVNLLSLYFQKLEIYSNLAYEQFTRLIFQSTNEVIELVKIYKAKI